MNSISPYFSVMIPAFKGRFLADCIESVLTQTDNDFELIIVDDASPENLKAIVEKFRDPRIRYFRNEVGFGAYNVVGNWNKCLEYSRGKYVLCMGDDDRLLPNCLADYRNIINKYPGLGLYHTRLQEISQDGEVTDVSEGRPEYESVYSHIWHDITGRRDQCIGDFLYEVGHLREIGGFYDLPYAWNADRLTAAYAAWGKGVANTATFGFQYRTSNQTITSTASNVDGKIEALLKSEEWFSKQLQEIPEDIIDRLYAELSKKALKSFTRKFILYAISDCVGKNPFMCLYWMFKLPRYGMGFVYAFKLFSMTTRRALGF